MARKKDKRLAEIEYVVKSPAFDSQLEAQSVLDAMNDIITKYGIVSVADLYDLSSIPVDSSELNKQGWTDLKDCKVTLNLTTGVWTLDLPKAVSIFGI